MELGLTPAVKLSLAASGVFLMTAMLLGILKYHHMLKAPNHQAPFYIDTAHRAALLYSFAALVIAELLRYSPFSETVQVIIAAAPLLFFAIAILIYFLLGLKNQTDNQFRERNFNTTVGMWLLIVAEVGGFGMILYGFFCTQFFAS
jgi:hypothetical protein